MRSLKQIFSPAAPYAMLPVRLALFATFFFHGTQKLFGWFGGPGLGGTSEFLGSLGVPLPSVVALLVALVETVGAVSFLVGAGVRLFALLLSIVRLMAIATVHLGNSWDFLNGSIEFHVAIIGMCLALFLGGPGWASIEWADEEGAAPTVVG